MAQKAGVGRAAQQPVQFMQLAALAFPADPARFAGVPDPLAVQQQEAVAAGRRAIAPIEPGNAGRCRFQQRLIAIDMLGRGIEPVGEQREMQLALPGWRGGGPPDARSALRSRRLSSAASAPRRACASARARRCEVPKRATALRRSRASRRGSPAPPPRRWPAPARGYRASRSHAGPTPCACSVNSGMARRTAATTPPAPT